MMNLSFGSVFFVVLKNGKWLSWFEFKLIMCYVVGGWVSGYVFC